MTHAQVVEDAHALRKSLMELVEEAPLMSWQRMGYIAAYYAMGAVTETLDGMAEGIEEGDE